ncbi:hypothetical protein [Leptolyngbya sp. KIOST-1]|uniref:hypothetical protein n=1 Tax=Leptolyngbya sp. KIOST-1 TaxID=1229172 RepID=UPI00056A528F|nr:hypothetical protein [Leptolyngbya sp. KIOST-1]
MTVAVPAQASNLSTSYHTQGHVDVAPGVAVAPGVLLGAAPGCRLVIAAGVCLGADVVVQASQGDLVLEPGVSLGSGVLVVGHGSIGQHTCIGANSTLLNPCLGPAQVVAPGSLVGDPSQTQEQQSAAGNEGNGGGQGQLRPWEVMESSNHGTGATQSGPNPGENAQNGHSSNGHAASGHALTGSSIYGKAQVNRLLATLFPHRQALNGATPEDRP